MQKKGFTLIEILIAIALIVIMGGIAIIALNPGEQLARGRNAARISNLHTILNAIWQNKSDNKSAIFDCGAGDIPTSATKMAVDALNYDIAPCLVPIYLPEMPYDPNAAGAHYAATTDYDTGYNIMLNASTSRITVSAPNAELGETISVTR